MELRDAQQLGGMQVIPMTELVSCLWVECTRSGEQGTVCKIGKADEKKPEKIKGEETLT